MGYAVRPEQPDDRGKHFTSLELLQPTDGVPVLGQPDHDARQKGRLVQDGLSPVLNGSRFRNDLAPPAPGAGSAPCEPVKDDGSLEVGLVLEQQVLVVPSDPSSSRRGHAAAQVLLHARYERFGAAGARQPRTRSQAAHDQYGLRRESDGGGRYPVECAGQPFTICADPAVQPRPIDPDASAGDHRAVPPSAGGNRRPRT